MKLVKKAISILMATSMIATASFVSASAVDLKSSDLPSSYSSVEKGYVTPVRHQGDTNTCWAHSTIAACEASMIKNNGYDTSLDLAELHLAYSAYHASKDKMGMFDGKQGNYMNNYIMAGSHCEDALFVLANQQGVVTEDANHGQFSSQKLLINNPEYFSVPNTEALYSYNEATVKNAYKAYPSNSDLVKEYIIKYGAGTMEYRADEEFFNKENNAQYAYEPISYTSHAVTVVGWDDNYPKENFTVDGNTPNKNGAWLIKNSYGAESYNDGYIWISYEDKTINLHPCIFYEISDEYLYSNVYQYDDLCVENFLYTGEDFVDEAYMANIFTAQKDNETLDAVSFYTSNEVLDYTVDIYTNIEDNTNPTNGTHKLSVDGEDLIMGYHTINLPSSVALEKGKQFSVVVTLKNKSDASSSIKVNIDAPTNPRIQNKKTAYGESFYSYDSNNWTDLKTVENGNMRIKAFTSSDNLPTITPDYYDTVYGNTREELHNELGKTLEKCDEAFNQNYEYVLNQNYLSLMYELKYAKDAYNTPDIFLAIEFDFLINNLEFRYSSLEKYNFEDIKHHETNNMWEDFVNQYDETLEVANNSVNIPNNMQPYIYDMNNTYITYVNSAISEGACNSYMQNFGDADNNYEVNISDATEIQKILAGYKDFDFYSYYNSDVNGDDVIDIRDVTEIQKFLADRTEYFPVYTKQFNGEEVDLTIDIDTAYSKLVEVRHEVSVSGVMENSYNDVPFLVLSNVYGDARNVIYNYESYHPVVIDFKARCLEYTYQNYLESQG